MEGSTDAADSNLEPPGPGPRAGKAILSCILTWVLLSGLLGAVEAFFLFRSHPYEAGYALVSWAILLYGAPGLLGGLVWGAVARRLSRVRRLEGNPARLVSFFAASWAGVFFFKILAPRFHLGPLLRLHGMAFLGFLLLVLAPLSILVAFLLYRVLAWSLRRRIPGFFIRPAGVYSLLATLLLLFLSSRYSPEISSLLLGAEFRLDRPSTHGAVEPGNRRNVILIVLDTLRRDRLSCYDYSRPTTPNIDRLAERGVLFRNAYSSSCWTPPAHSSLFTGDYPSKTGVLGGIRAIPQENRTLAEILDDEGYLTLSVVANSMISGAFGYGQGFRVYDELYDVESGYKNAAFFLRNSLLYGWLQNERRALPLVRILTALIVRQKTAALFVGSELDAQHVNERVFHWLDLVPEDRPFFLFINYIDVHSPYDPPDSLAEEAGERYTGWIRGLEGYELMDTVHRVEEEFRQGDTSADADAAYLSDLYDGELVYLDREVGELLAGLAERQRMDNTLLVITSDHGEQFGEHGLMEHRNSLYQELVRIPLLFYDPGRLSPETIPSMVSLSDVPVTLLDLLGVPAPEGVQGRSLLPLLAGERQEAAERPIITEWRDSKSSIEGGWKYIRSADSETEELYQLEEDPHETRNRIEEAPRVLVEHLEGTLDEWMASFEPVTPSGEEVRMNDMLRPRLRARGYLD